MRYINHYGEKKYIDYRSLFLSSASLASLIKVQEIPKAPKNFQKAKYKIIKLERL